MPNQTTRVDVGVGHFEKPNHVLDSVSCWGWVEVGMAIPEESRRSSQRFANADLSRAYPGTFVRLDHRVRARRTSATFPYSGLGCSDMPVSPTALL